MELSAHHIVSNFAHDMVMSQTLWGRLGSFIQKPLVAIILVTIIIKLLMIGAVFLLKRHTTWRFPYQYRSNTQGDE